MFSYKNWNLNVISFLHSVSEFRGFWTAELYQVIKDNNRGIIVVIKYCVECAFQPQADLKDGLCC